MTDKFSSKLESQTVSTLVTRLENKDGETIILNPQYQRNIIWNENDMCYFLNSIYHGIIPNNILFNVDKDGNFVCMDGKQRLTSLLLFKQNKIPIIETSNDNQSTYIYYSIIPEKYETDSKYKKLTQPEKNKFNATPIPIITYTDLSYSEQTDVFHRIQHGKILSAGEILMSLFSDDESHKILMKFCDGKSNIIGIDTKRKDHVIEIVNILYITEKEDRFKKPSKIQRETYIKQHNKLALIKKETERISKLIDIFFSDKIINHCTIEKKDLYVDLKYAVCKLLYDLFKNKINSITKEEYTNFRSSIRKMMRSTGLDKKTNQSIYILIRTHYGKLTENNEDVSDIDDFEPVDNNFLKRNKPIDPDTSQDEENNDDKNNDLIDDLSDNLSDDETNNKKQVIKNPSKKITVKGVSKKITVKSKLKKSD